MTQKHSTTSVGDALERRVSTYYEALGYRVTRNVNISGHQIDIVAEKVIAGASPIKIAIEAKSRTSSLGVNDVTPFLATVKHLILDAKITSAVIVTDTRITQDARLAVEASRGVRLMELSQLELDLFNSSESLLRIRNDYENSPIFSEYYSIALSSRTKNEKDAVKFINSWCDRHQGTLIVLGDFGSGKSTILERAFYETVVDRLQRANAPYPLMLKLRALRHYSDLWNFVESSLRDNQYFMPPKSSFSRELEAGRLRLFLDGFDEIYTGATIDDRASYLTLLSPLLTAPSPCVLSSRPTFFDSISQVMSAVLRLNKPLTPLEGLPDYMRGRRIAASILGSQGDSLNSRTFSEVIHLEGLGDEQISIVIEKHRAAILENTGLDPAQFKAGLYRIYDLRDLMTRPILLEMIVKTTSEGELDLISTKTIEPSALYALYTQVSALRDEEKGRSIHYLKVVQRLAACREIAWAMLLKGEIVLTASEIRKIVPQAMAVRSKKAAKKAAKDQFDKEEVNRALTDIKVCSFLRFSDDGSLTFTHKSYFEFFVAQRMFLLSKNDQPAFIKAAELKISKETLYFLASYARDHPKFRDYIKMRLRMESTEDQRDFLHRIAYGIGSILDQCTFLNGTIRGVDMVRASVSSLYFDGVAIEDSTMRDVNGSAWTFKEVALKQVVMEGVQLDGSQIAFVADDLEISDSAFVASNLHIAGTRIRFQDVRFDGSQLTLSSTLLAIGMTMKAGTLLFSEGGVLSPKSSVRFENAQLRSNDVSGWYSNGADIELHHCRIVGLWLGASDLTNFGQDARRPRLRLAGCTGVAVVAMSGDQLTEAAIGAMMRANPDLTLIDQAVVVRAQEFAAKQDQAHRERIENKADDKSEYDSENAEAAKVPRKARAKKDSEAFQLPPEIAHAQTQVSGAIRQGEIEETILPSELRALLNLQSG